MTTLATADPTVATRPTVYPTIGIDPGQRWCALAARIDGRCLDATILDRGVRPERGTVLGQDDGPFIDRLHGTIQTMMERHHAQAVEAAAVWQATWQGTPWRIAVEGIVVTVYGPLPTQLAKLRVLPSTALVLGAVMGVYGSVVVVRPGKLGNHNHAKHGDILARLGPYPRDLQGRRPRWFLKADDGATDREHERSAWAVAGAAQLARPLLLAGQEATA